MQEMVSIQTPHITSSIHGVSLNALSFSHYSFMQIYRTCVVIMFELTTNEQCCWHCQFLGTMSGLLQSHIRNSVKHQR